MLLYLDGMTGHIQLDDASDRIPIYAMYQYGRVKMKKFELFGNVFVGQQPGKVKR